MIQAFGKRIKARKDKKGIYEIKDQSAPNRFYPHVHHMSKQKTIINYHFIMRKIKSQVKNPFQD